MIFEKLSVKIKEDKKILFVLAIGLLGTAILIFSGNGSESDDIITENAEQEIQNSTSAYSVTEVEALLEEKLEAIVSQIQGVGSVSAAVSVGSSGEYIYAENIKSEEDSDSSSSDSEIVIYESGEGGDTGLVISVRSPDIIGVAIVCQGGGSSVVKAEITKLVTSLFGIGSDRVYVGGKA